MKCLHCGYCCKYLSVVIVDNPELGIREDNLITHLGNGIPCKHLAVDKEYKYYCKIHHYEWYKETPCSKHVQIESSKDDLCRMGVFILKKVKTNLDEGGR